LIVRIPQFEKAGLTWPWDNLNRPEYFLCCSDAIWRQAKLVLQHPTKLGDNHLTQDELVLR
jgi:hypothetical protein